MASPAAQTCSLAELREGDVLMCLGTKPISRLVADLEEGKYSHAAYYEGGGHFIHGTVRKDVSHVLKEPVDSLLNTSVYQYVDVYRPKVFGSGASPGSVTAAAQKLVERPYDHESLWLVALIVALESPLLDAARLIRNVQILRGFARAQYASDAERAGFLSRLRAALENLRAGQQARFTCTEVVTTAFWNADERDGKYALEFTPPNLLRVRRLLGRWTADPGDSTEPRSVDEVCGLANACVDAVEHEEAEATIGSKLSDLLGKLLPAAAPASVWAGRRPGDLPLNMVSPREMEYCLSLEPVGRLVRGANDPAPGGPSAS